MSEIRGPSPEEMQSRRHESAKSEFPFLVEPKTMHKSGAEAEIRRLSEGKILKTLKDSRPETLAQHKKEYEYLSKYYGDFLVPTLFVRGKDQTGDIKNFIVQEEVSGPTLNEIKDLTQLLAVTPELTQQLLDLSRLIEDDLKRRNSVPDPTLRNIMVDQSDQQTHLKLVDYGEPFSGTSLDTRFDDEGLTLNIYQNLSRQLEKDLAQKKFRFFPGDLIVKLPRVANWGGEVMLNTLPDYFQGKLIPAADPTNPVLTLMHKNQDTIKTLKSQATNEEDFIRKFVDQYGLTLTKSIVDQVMGTSIDDPKLEQRLTSDIFK